MAQKHRDSRGQQGSVDKVSIRIQRLGDSLSLSAAQGHPGEMSVCQDDVIITPALNDDDIHYYIITFYESNYTYSITQVSVLAYFFFVQKVL